MGKCDSLPGIKFRISRCNKIFQSEIVRPIKFELHLCFSKNIQRISSLFISVGGDNKIFNKEFLRQHNIIIAWPRQAHRT